MPTQLEFFELPGDPDRGGGMVVGAGRGLHAWLAEIDRQLAFMRPSTLNSGRFDATARLLTAERLRGSSDGNALSEVGVRLCDARQAIGRHFMT